MLWASSEMRFSGHFKQRRDIESDSQYGDSVPAWKLCNVPSVELEGVYKKSEDCCIWDKWMNCIIWSITGLCCMRFLIQMILTIAGTFRGRYVSLHSVYLQMPEKLLTKLSILSVSSSYILQSTCEWTWSSCTYSHAVSLIDVSVLTMLSLFCAWMLPFFACWDSEHIFQMW